MKKITAVIPVRQGSQRVKNKNFKEFAGKSLLEHKIDVIKKLPVEDIIVNTDSEYAISLAIKNNIAHKVCPVTGPMKRKVLQIRGVFYE